MTVAATTAHGIHPCQGGTAAAAPGALARGLWIAYAGSALGDQMRRNAKVTHNEASAASTSVSE